MNGTPRRQDQRRREPRVAAFGAPRRHSRRIQLSTPKAWTTGFGGNPEKRAVSPSPSAAVITGLCPLFLWIPATPVITADGCDDWGDENDGGQGIRL